MLIHDQPLIRNHLLAHLSRRLIGELIVYPWSGVRPSASSSVVHNAQTSSSQKPLGRSNKNIKMSSFKSSENIQKKEGGPDRSVSDNQSSSVTLDELAMKARRIL